MSILSAWPRATSQLTSGALLLLVLLAAPGCSDDDDDPVTDAEGPDLVSFTQPNLYPEGVQYDAKNKYFLVGSQTAGAVGMVHEDGHYMQFADNAALVSSIGMNLDEGRNRLLVAVSDPGYNAQRTAAATQRKLARLVIINRDNGQVTSTVDLGGLKPGQNHFANDIAVDAQGNAYITDSFSPVIYKVDVQGVASIFLENAQLAAPAGSFGLNGIVYHPDGYLLVAKSDEGAIFKIPLTNPAGLTKVTISQDLKGIDGMLLLDNTTLHVVTNAQAKVYRLTTATAWTAATATGTFTTPPQYPTTLARRSAAETYVLYSNLNALQAKQNPPVSQFSIAKVKF
ncbi:SMP-30/gluconolactonase/LRE family protein [Hymenobacter mucosus]|uniref:SMP-30/Gluconolaconase/LRE-like region-containing protein n=1 Tax=Hymenobacter mucosus TaxID=1411120 RepID=A0A238XVG9_9BACT|nr:SMP-30/gluconolactonase/LRE family protein [Hymenobacter mucosus]SNR62548.1 SMP-30/Gluconolaconase/LRE-like region-containing protein [Hymenobacter mucosus]